MYDEMIQKFCLVQIVLSLCNNSRYHSQLISPNLGKRDLDEKEEVTHGKSPTYQITVRQASPGDVGQTTSIWRAGARRPSRERESRRSRCRPAEGYAGQDEDDRFGHCET